jgi:DNA polymerase III subunit gamma/tau
MNGIDSRPLTFEEVLGQKPAKTLIFNALKQNILSRAYIFSGAWSSGKTTLASIFARSLLCTNRDPVTMSPCNKCKSCRNFLNGSHSSYLEVDSVTSSTKDAIQNILETLQYEIDSDYRIIFFDEAHDISTAGKDALLKELETPIEYDKTIFMFSTNQINKMPSTLLSRCARVPLESPSIDTVYKKITTVCDTNGLSYDGFALKNLAVWANGHYRDAENAIEPLILMGGITSENVAAYTSYDQEASSALLIAMNSNLSEALRLCEDMTVKYGTASVYSSLIRTLLEAIQFGLSGLSLNVPECIKNVYSVFGSKMNGMLSNILSRGNTTDGKYLQAEIVDTYYSMLKSGFEMSSPRESLPKGKKEEGKQEGVSKETQSGAIYQKGDSLGDIAARQHAQRKIAGMQPQIDPISTDNLAKKWGPEEVSETVILRRA